MKIKILTFNILLHSFMLHSSEPTQTQKVTWQCNETNLLWQLKDDSYHKILKIRTEEKKHREQINNLNDIALLSINIKKISKTVRELSKILTSIEKIIAERSVVKK